MPLTGIYDASSSLLDVLLERYEWATESYLRSRAATEPLFDVVADFNSNRCPEWTARARFYQFSRDIEEETGVDTRDLTWENAKKGELDICEDDGFSTCGTGECLVLSSDMDFMFMGFTDMWACMLDIAQRAADAVNLPEFFLAVYCPSEGEVFVFRSATRGIGVRNARGAVYAGTTNGADEYYALPDEVLSEAELAYAASGEDDYLER